MKLAILYPYFYPKKGGVENYIYHIVNSINLYYRDYVNEIVVITSKYDKTLSEFEWINPITKVYRLPYRFVISSTPISIMWYPKIKKILKKENPDIINVHMPVPFMSDIGIKLAQELKIPCVLTYHNDITTNIKGLNFMIKAYIRVLMRALNNCDMIIATSWEYSKSSPILSRYLHKIRVIPPGLNPRFQNLNSKLALNEKFVKALNLPKNKDIILFVGRLDREAQHKGLDILLYAFSEILRVNNQAIVIVVGDGNTREYYQSLTKRLGMEKYVFFLGKVTDNELAYLYSISDIFVMPSYNRTEGFGIVYLEAQFFKTPCIGTYVGGIPYAIQHNKSGYLVKPKDVEDLKNAILMLIENKKKARKLGHIGSVRTKKLFMWKSLTKRFLEVLKEVLKNESYDNRGIQKKAK
ncbi:glycosyltransferase [Pyrococcus kukulkanii]|uniref:glycosyltransferase n=1 Tax=Pyrococcus kukulkanii TaxID=1609559 RepID=UPI003568693B